MQLNPQQLRQLAESLENASKALRESASLMEGFSQPSSVKGLASAFHGARTKFHGGGEAVPLASTIPVAQRITVREAAAVALSKAHGPLHINELFNQVRSLGGEVKDVATLSSMLSKDKARFIPASGMRGHWQLAPLNPGELGRVLGELSSAVPS